MGCVEHEGRRERVSERQRETEKGQTEKKEKE